MRSVNHRDGFDFFRNRARIDAVGVAFRVEVELLVGVCKE
jgi:hypothetical protein